MKHILDDAQTDVLARLARADALLAFDFDGTLAPIVADPESAALSVRTRELLAELTTLYPCAVVSGRSLADLSPRLAGLPFRRLVGNHGVEPGSDLERYAELVRGFHEQLAAQLEHEPGVELENKRYTLSVHYRRAADPGHAAASIQAAAHTLGDAVRIVPGKCVFNVVPLGAPDKGVALAELCRSLGVSAALYAGDDDTDEDVFERAPADGSVIGIRVDRVATRAPYYVAEQSEMDELLQRLARMRRDLARAQD